MINKENHPEPAQLKLHPVFKILEDHVPENAVHYCFDLWDQYRFNFIITQKRNTKLGDYRFKGSTNTHTITINNNLNKYSFLITFLHEVAHLITFTRYRKKVLPHGAQWKSNFKALFTPMLNDLVFPEELIPHLKNYFSNIKASSCSDQSLSKALSVYDGVQENLIHLSDIPPGAKFLFHKKEFQMETSKRTRIICMEVSSGKRYLISKIAKVELLN